MTKFLLIEKWSCFFVYAFQNIRLYIKKSCKSYFTYQIPLCYLTMIILLEKHLTFSCSNGMIYVYVLLVK